MTHRSVGIVHGPQREEMRTKQLLGLAIGLCVAFLAILSVLHVLEPEFNPPHLISEYQLGRFGSWMSLAFSVWERLRSLSSQQQGKKLIQERDALEPGDCL